MASAVKVIKEFLTAGEDWGAAAGPPDNKELMAFLKSVDTEERQEFARQIDPSWTPPA